MADTRPSLDSFVKRPPLDSFYKGASPEGSTSVNIPGPSPFGSISPRERLATLAMAGIPAAIGGVPPKEVPSSLPLIGQLIGGALGGLPGAVGGETAGNIGEQAANRIMSGTPFDPKDIAINTGITLGTEGLFRGMGKLAYGNAPDAFKLKTLGTQLGKMKEFISNAGDTNAELSIPKNEIVGQIDDVLGRLKGASGGTAALLRRWRNVFMSTEGDAILARDLIRFESLLNDSLNFRKINIGGFELNLPVKDSQLDRAAKGIRNYISGKVDSVAELAGLPEFKNISREVSKAKMRVAETATKRLADVLKREFVSGSVGALIGSKNDNALKGALIGGLLGFNPSYSYKIFGRTPLGRAATLATSETVRRNKKELY